MSIKESALKIQAKVLRDTAKELLKDFGEIDRVNKTQGRRVTYAASRLKTKAARINRDDYPAWFLGSEASLQVYILSELVVELRQDYENPKTSQAEKDRLNFSIGYIRTTAEVIQRREGL